jgi:hypothetical protein
MLCQPGEAVLFGDSGLKITKNGWSPSLNGDVLTRINDTKQSELSQLLPNAWKKTTA